MNKTLALLVRAFRSESRDIKSHLIRAGLVLLIIMLFMSYASSIQYQTAPGREMFLWMTWANWALITFVGGAVFSAAISEETEQQTLGLLRMANIGPLSLLLGKWLPRLWVAFLLVSAQFPFTWLTITLGGVSWAQIEASYLLLVAHLFMVGNLALFCSVWQPDNASAGAWTFKILAAWRFGPLLLWGLAELLAEMDLFPKAWAHEGGALVARQNSWTAGGRLFLDLQRTSFDGSMWSEQVISNLVIGAFFFLAAWLMFDRLTVRHLTGGAPTTPLIAKLLSKKGRRSRPVWEWAIGWKDFIQAGGGQRGVVLKLVLYGVIAGVVIVAHSLSGANRYTEMFEVLCGVLAWIAFFIVLPLELTTMAARLFRAELKNQTWSTLLTLPKSIPEIAYSKLAGAALGLIPTACVLCVAASPFIVEILEEIAREATAILVIAYAVSIVVICLHAITYFSITVDWASTPVAIILGVVTTGAAQMVPWFFFAMLMMGVGGSGDEVAKVWMMMLSVANFIGAGLLHVGIGKQLEAKGAAS